MTERRCLLVPSRFTTYHIISVAGCKECRERFALLQAQQRRNTLHMLSDLTKHPSGVRVRSRRRCSSVSLSPARKIMACFTLALSLQSPSSFSKVSHGPDACIPPMCNSVTTCPLELRKKSGAFASHHPSRLFENCAEQFKPFSKCFRAPIQNIFILHDLAESLSAVAFASFQMRGNQHKLSLFKMEKRWMDEHSQKHVLPSRGNDIDQAIRGYRRCLSVVLICAPSLGLPSDKARFPNGVHRTGR